jgi:hypothetical protein
VTYGGIVERTGQPPTEAKRDNLARVLGAAADHTRSLGPGFGIEPVNRYENHTLHTGWQAFDMIEKLRPGAADPGEIVDEAQTVLGVHRGVIHYTVGQRKGTGI